MQQNNKNIPHLMRLGTGLALAFWVSAAQAQMIPPEDLFQPRDRPTLNFYGSPGLIDMPTGEALPDGTFALGYSFFAGTSRSTMTFQATPRLSFSFRYAGINDLNIGGFENYRDRSFDARFLVKREDDFWPAITIGLQDFAGTGIYAGEYVVATKTFDGGARLPGTFKLTGGLGWGRLGSSGAIGSPFGADRPVFTGGDTGGEPSVDQWFRGPAAPFAGLEWQVNDRFGLKVEYSSDAYEAEVDTAGIFTRKSKFNFGAEYQYNDRLRLGAYYLYGSEFGINVQYQFHPNNPGAVKRTGAVGPVPRRPDRNSQPDAWSTNWTSEVEAPRRMRDALKPQLAALGLTFEALQVSAQSAELRYRNDRYQTPAIAIGRAARVMAATLPASIETFRIVTMQNGLAKSAVTIRRTDLEQLEFEPEAADALLAVSGIGEAAPALPGAIMDDTLYPDFAWSIGPYLANSYFDPDEPVRVDAGVKLQGTYRPAPGWEIAGELRYRVVGNIADSDRVSNSRIEPVRSNGVRYAQDDFSLENLYVSKQWKPVNDLYARVTAGYLERMFGGISAELLWKPVTSRLALGLEANYVQQRDFSGFGFQDYRVATGHASAYYEFGNGYHGQVDVGRYLAGDLGATFTVTREFANGFRVGGFFTLTDVSAEDFGEGSFDKGINLEVPLGWILGQPSKRTLATTIRPVQRDGGARLEVPGRLYEQVRNGHRHGLENNWSRVWE